MGIIESRSPLLFPDRTHLSDLEAAWAAAKKGFMASPRRSAFYDADSLLFFAPLQYDIAPITAHEPAAPPSLEWVSREFQLLVLGDPMHEADRGSCPPLPEKALQASRFASESVVYEYLERTEQTLVYSDLLEHIIRDRTLTLEDKIARVLCEPRIGTKENKTQSVSSLLRARLTELVRNKLPIQLFIPAFPFKDQNPFSTMAPADHLDFGDVALLIRLHAIALALYQIYSFGVEWIIASDSVAYAPIFGIDRTHAATYRERLREYRQRLNLGSTIHILDLDDLTQRLDGFSETFEAIHSELVTLVTHPDVTLRFAKLVRDMRWNMSTRHLLKKYEWIDLWTLLNGRTDPRPEMTKAAEEIDATSREVALNYASHVLSMKHLDLNRRCFPSAIRATVHPKAGQIAIPHLGVEFPWNGSAVLIDDNLYPGGVCSMELYEIFRQGAVTPVYLPGEDAPFYFQLAPGATWTDNK